MLMPNGNFNEFHVDNLYNMVAYIRFGNMAMAKEPAASVDGIS